MSGKELVETVRALAVIRKLVKNDTIKVKSIDETIYTILKNC